MIIKRDRYLNQLIERRNNGLIKVITGIRRCGKSFLLFELFAEYMTISMKNTVTRMNCPCISAPL